MDALKIFRLGPGDEALAREMFTTLTDVFGEDDGADDERGEPLRDADIAALMRRRDFWALVAIEATGAAGAGEGVGGHGTGGTVVGGLTAHALPMTRDRSTELFIYDLAVPTDRQRRGIGRALVATLLSLGREAGIGVAFVPADNEDTHALDFYRAVGGEESPVTFFTFATDTAPGGDNDNP
jgi:aminoglycoside 3-N-acetyltransferase I